MKKRMLRYVVLAMMVALLMGGAFIMSDESLRPNPTLPQKLADGELNNPAYVNQKLDEMGTEPPLYIGRKRRRNNSSQQQIRC